MSFQQRMQNLLQNQFIVFYVIDMHINYSAIE